MENENKIGLSAKSPADYYFWNTDIVDYTIKTEKVERKSQSIEWHEKIDLIIDIPDTKPILLTHTENDDIPYIRIENDDKEALEELLRYLYRQGYRRYK